MPSRPIPPCDIPPSGKARQNFPNPVYGEVIHTWYTAVPYCRAEGLLP